ncbi:MAG: hypothetical protein J6K26_08025 [Lachnospiraceae bacterium]|nr:hypothetical protein [Lachnospiraceae bacterium]
MEKTMKQLADELGVNKQRVYRYIKKNCINEAHQDKGVKYYDEAAQTIIKQGFLNIEPLQESTSKSTSDTLNETVIEVLKKQTEILQKELEIKNQQISELNARLAESQRLLDQQQQLTAIAEKKVMEIEKKPDYEMSPEDNKEISESKTISEPEQDKKWWRRLFG